MDRNRLRHTGRRFADGESPRKGVPSGRKKPLTMSSATPLSCQSDRDLQPVLFSEPERSYAQELAESKRFVERYRGDDRFREQLSDRRVGSAFSGRLPTQSGLSPFASLLAREDRLSR